MPICFLSIYRVVFFLLVRNNPSLFELDSVKPPPPIRIVAVGRLWLLVPPSFRSHSVLVEPLLVGTGCPETFFPPKSPISSWHVSCPLLSRLARRFLGLSFCTSCHHLVRQILDSKIQIFPNVPVTESPGLLLRRTLRFVSVELGFSLIL